VRLDYLSDLIEIERCQSISGAAQNLYLGQTTLSTILKNVEAHIEEERQIGAEVTVVAATPKAATVVGTVQVASGYNITDIRQNVQTALQSYIDSVNREDFDTAPVRGDENRKSSISYCK